MRHEVRWERMFPDELEAALEACPMVYLPYGLCEPHGWHNAVGMDAIRAHECSCQAAQEHGGIVAPPFYWHCHEIGGYGAWGHNQVDQERPWANSNTTLDVFEEYLLSHSGSGCIGFSRCDSVFGTFRSTSS